MRRVLDREQGRAGECSEETAAIHRLAISREAGGLGKFLSVAARGVQPFLQMSTTD